MASAGSASIMSNYRVRYQLRPHRRDQFIEFIRELLLGPFVMMGGKTFLTMRSMNRAQVYAISDKLRMVTLDGDQTLYEDGGNFALKPLADALVALMEAGIYVALVTAAGYPHQPKRYEERLDGLMQRFQTADPECLSRFFVLGGECNFLFKVAKDSAHSVPHLEEDPLFVPDLLKSVSQESIQKLLDTAHDTLLERKEALDLDVQVIRKSRAVGIIPQPGIQLPREQLDEIVLGVQHDCSSLGVPFCAFNGGRDVWVDVGNKHIGVAALQQWLHCPKHATLHIGDQFLGTGNDISTRQTSCTVWISSPKETGDILALILQELRELKSRA
eukprot:tig00000448_g859.t1